MVKDAEAHADEDKVRRDMVEAKNQAEALIHSTEKTISELSDKASDADTSTVETAIEELKSALEGDDVDDIKAKSESLSQVSMKLGEALYQAQQAEAGEGEGDPVDADDSASENEDVVDADFEEVDDDDKKSA
jgi:molecular chaperone DnaK